MRQCGDCQLCCKLLPIKGLRKPANARCAHQKHRVGCTIYKRRPMECALWNCRWLVEDDTADLSRPDRSHYVIDSMPDFVTLDLQDGSPPAEIHVVQVWVDPSYEDAHRDPALRRFIHRRSEEGLAALIRWGSSRGLIIFGPGMTPDHTFREVEPTGVSPEHSANEIYDAMVRR